MAITPAMKRFMSAERFAVVGRVLTDRSRWDNKVLRWYADAAGYYVSTNADRYIDRGLSVIPIRSNEGEAESLAIHTDPTQLPDLSTTSVSVIISPKYGLQLLKDLFEGSRQPHGVWFQPGAEDASIAEYVNQNGLGDRVVFGDHHCVLVEGDAVRKSFGGGKEKSSL